MTPIDKLFAKNQKPEFMFGAHISDKVHGSYYKTVKYLQKTFIQPLYQFVGNKDEYIFEYLTNLYKFQIELIGRQAAREQMKIFEKEFYVNNPATRDIYQEFEYNALVDTYFNYEAGIDFYKDGIAAFIRDNKLGRDAFILSEATMNRLLTLSKNIKTLQIS